MSEKPDCGRIQSDLVNYLNIGVDPYDMPRDFLLGWADKVGIEIKDREEAHAGDLTPEQLEGYEDWLRGPSGQSQIARWVREDPFGTPAYLTMDDAKALPENTWCVHFAKHHFDSFDRGTTLEGLHLSTWKKEKTFVDCSQNLDLEKAGPFDIVWGFAFTAEMFFGRNGPALFLSKRGKYNESAILFQTDCGVEAWHSGDEERQVIFPLCSERNLVPILWLDSRDGVVTVQGDDGDEVKVPSLEALIEQIEREAEEKAKPKRRARRRAAAT